MTCCEVLDMRYRFTPLHTKCIFKQLLNVLIYMNENKYVHQDLKSSNALIDDHFRIKFTNFGLARKIPPPLFQNVINERIT